MVNYFLEELASKPGCAPLILIHFIDMCLMRETKTQDKNCNAYFFGAQHTIQQVLLLVALLCVPVLLLGTPIYEMVANKKKKIKAEVSARFCSLAEFIDSISTIPTYKAKFQNMYTITKERI